MGEPISVENGLLDKFRFATHAIAAAPSVSKKESRLPL